MNQTEIRAGLINQERLKNFLIELIKIDSLSRKELNVAMRLKREMEELGAKVFIDDAGEKVGGNVGNLIAHFPGNVAGAEPLLLSAHMDTVVPGVRRYLLAYAYSDGAFGGFQPVTQVRTSPVSGTGTRMCMVRDGTSPTTGR